MMNPITWLAENTMLPFLSFSYAYIFPNFGVAIILLTILVKIIFWPLNTKQYKAMKMQKMIQPELKKLQEKYKGQPDKLNKEMMKLWKDNNANPFTGCLPMLVQIPFFFAIFYAMKSPKFNALIAQPNTDPGLFSFWLPNLAQPDHFFILPVIIGLTLYWSQKISITDPKQARMFMLLPFVMVFICLKMPAGLLLYWAVSQALSVAQQLYILKTDVETPLATDTSITIKS